MAFESGSISCRFFHLPRALPKDAVERFARHAAPPLDSIAAGMVAGWVTGRHLLDRQITADTAFFGGWLRLVLLQAERKIPASLLHAECRMEELAQLAASGREFLNRQERAEIKRSVAARLLPKMPPQIKGIPLVHKPGEHTLYAGAGSAKQCDLLTARWLAALGYHLIPITPAVAALERKKVDVNDWHPASFSPDLDDADMTVQPGRDFLTWLWHTADTGAGTVDLGAAGEIGVLIEGPLTFVHEGHGAYETVLRKGQPVNSAEARTCLLSGKKLRQARLSLTRGEQAWAGMLDADEFVFRGLTLPEPEPNVGAVNRFEQRMEFLDQFRNLFLALYDQYVEERRNPTAWKATRKKMRDWVKDRPARA